MMATLLCPNITSDQTNYSAPMPFIGLYIAGATVVCFLLMTCDLLDGIRRRKFWFPCHLFSLNSIGLTLVSVAAKLPVDLTTTMPSAQDQFSKLTGTALICVCMGFFIPSLATASASECFSNMAALSLLVITVVVNICIQMSTGVIFSFIPEHVIIMFFMLTMLIVLWLSTWTSNPVKEIPRDHSKDIFRMGKGSITMLQRLKLYYLHCYYSDRQFVLCGSLFSFHASTVCFFCLLIVLQVAFRYLLGQGFRFCNGVSDYGWSMWIIVVTQIFVILLASLITSFRGLLWLRRKNDKNYILQILQKDDEYNNFPFLNFDTGDSGYFETPLICVLVVATFLLALPILVVMLVYFSANSVLESVGFLRQKYTEWGGIQEYKELLHANNMVLEDWTLSKCVKDVEGWISAGQNSSSLSHLMQLLSKVSPSKASIQELRNQYNLKGRNEASCLHLVFLVRIASVSIPSTLSGHLEQSLKEVFHIIYFVDTKIDSLSYYSQKISLARDLWMGEDSLRDIHELLKGSVDEPSSQSAGSELDRALTMIREIKNALASHLIWKEVSVIMDFIGNQEFSSVEELFACMEQLFVDILHIFLVQLPEAIFKEVAESHVEEYEEKVRIMLKLICQAESLEGKVQWSFPVESNISSLIPTKSPITDHCNSAAAGNDDPNAFIASVTEGDEHNVDNAHPDGMIQVE